MGLVRRKISPEGLAAENAAARSRAVLGDTVHEWFLPRELRGEKKRLRHDLANQFEELVVEAASVVVHVERAGGPFVFVDASDVVLCLCGEWMYDAQVVAGGEIDPYRGWPRSMRLVRAPSTGQVLEVEVRESPQLGPETISYQLPYLGESYILKTPFERLRDALDELGDGMSVVRPEPP